MTETMDPEAADQALKGRHRAMWAMGDYHAVATEVIAGLGPVLVQACGGKPTRRHFRSTRARSTSCCHVSA